MNKVWDTVRDIVQRDIKHRQGWRPSEMTDLRITQKLIEEAFEVHDNPHDPDELADVLCIVIHQAQRIDCSQQELLERAVTKLHLRFPETPID